MASSTIYSRFVKRLTATAAFGLLTATSQAGLFCDWHVDHKRPYCSPACDPTWGYNETCWRQFPPTKPCTDWGAHCDTCSTGDMYNATGSYGANMGVGAMMAPIQQPAAGMMVQPSQGAVMMQQPLMIQNPQGYGGPINNMLPQNGINSYNANPAPVPPAGGQLQLGTPPRQQSQPRQNGARTYEPIPQNNQQQAAPQDNSQSQDAGLQLPGLGGDGGAGDGGAGNDGQGVDFGDGNMNLPKLPDLSQVRPYYNPGFNVQGNTNSYQQVSQQQNGYPNQTAFSQGNAAAVYPTNSMMPQGPPAQQYYGQPVQPQQAYPQPMGQQPTQMPAYPQAGNQVQAPQPGHYMPQPTAIQVVPGRQPSVVGVSFTQSIRPAANRTTSPRPVPVQKKSFLSKINPFSK